MKLTQKFLIFCNNMFFSNLFSNSAPAWHAAKVKTKDRIEQYLVMCMFVKCIQLFNDLAS